jgi:riboflavin kinase/FMN adenylyltransferase
MLFTAKVISGSGRGKGLGVPTLNLDLRDVPKEMEEGVFACRVQMANGEMVNGKYAAALHYGPRTMFKDTVSCEIHLIDTSIDASPASVSVETVEHLRDVREFATVEELKEQMQKDIEQAKNTLSRQERSSEPACPGRQVE